MNSTDHIAWKLAQACFQLYDEFEEHRNRSANFRVSSRKLDPRLIEIRALREDYERAQDREA